MPDKQRKSSGRIWLIIFALLAILIAIAIYRAASPKVAVPKDTVLMMELAGSLPEVVLSEGFPGFSPKSPITLQSALETLEKAKLDTRVKLTVLNISGLSTSQSKLIELREAIADYRHSGKEIWAFLSQFSGDAEYFLAAACDKIFFERYGVLILDGLKAELLYFKSTLGKIGVEYEVARRGKYKSAGESLTNDTISSANYEQYNAMLSDFDEAYVQGVLASRALSVDSYRSILNEQAYISDKSALEQRLVDSVCYFDEMMSAIRARFNISEEEDESLFLSAKSYQSVSYKSLGKSALERIAVVNVIGALVDGKSDYSPDGSSDSGDETLVAAIEEARKDKSIKAIILRVDSPGGSAIASDKILLALNKAKSEKPVVASMSGVAASGGYWVAMQSQKIVANPTTITGSIGVIALKPAVRELADKIGLKRTVISKSKYADAFNLFDKLSPEAYKKTDALIDYTYQAFLQKVADGRKMSVPSVDSIAQGRVWTGRRAKEIGLVDELGGMKRSIQVAKALANIDSAAHVELVSYPKSRDFWDSFFEGFGETSMSAVIAKSLIFALKEEASIEFFGADLMPTEIRLALRHLRMLSKFATLQPQTLMPLEIVVK